VAQPHSVYLIGLNNTGTEPIGLTFIFSAPGFGDTIRCNSVPAGEMPTRSRQHNKKTPPTWGTLKTRAGKNSPRNEPKAPLGGCPAPLLH